MISIYFVLILEMKKIMLRFLCSSNQVLWNKQWNGVYLSNIK